MWVRIDLGRGTEMFVAGAKSRPTRRGEDIRHQFPGAGQLPGSRAGLRALEILRFAKKNATLDCITTLTRRSE